MSSRSVLSLRAVRRAARQSQSYARDCRGPLREPRNDKGDMGAPGDGRPARIGVGIGVGVGIEVERRIIDTDTDSDSDPEARPAPSNERRETSDEFSEPRRARTYPKERENERPVGIVIASGPQGRVAISIVRPRLPRLPARRDSPEEALK